VTLIVLENMISSDVCRTLVVRQRLSAADCRVGADLNYLLGFSVKFSECYHSETGGVSHFVVMGSVWDDINYQIICNIPNTG
jgi:hypothetical protein